MPTIQIKAKNVSKDLINQMFQPTKVVKFQTKGKIKVNKKIRQEQQKKLENQDILNQSFNSENMNECKEEEVMKFKDSSSEGEEEIEQDNETSEEEPFDEYQSMTGSSPTISKGSP